MSASLESRYRRLLAFYPAAHRDVYEEEMLSVLLDGTREGQQRPGLRETANLIGSALRTWAGSTATGLTDDRWHRAAGAVGLLLPFFLLLDRLQAASAGLISWSAPGAMTGLHPEGVTAFNGIALALAVGWAATIVLALIGRWRAAAAVAAAACAGQTAVLASIYPRHPVVVVISLWTVVLGVIAVGTLWSARGLKRGLPIRRRSLAILSAAIPLAFAAPLLSPSEGPPGGPWIRAGDGAYRTVNTDIALIGFHVPEPFSFIQGPVLLILFASLVLGLVGLLRIETGIRRRVIALLAPIAALALLVETAMPGFMMSSLRFDPPVLLSAGEWIALVGVPAATFVVATIVVHRRDRVLELIEIGRSARRAAALQ